MFESRSNLLSFECFEDFGTEQATPEPAGSLIGTVIVAYERALDEGTNPAAALSALLDWASEEIKRYIR